MRFHTSQLSGSGQQVETTRIVEGNRTMRANRSEHEQRSVSVQLFTAEIAK